jgi:hypothetical protein
MTRALRNLFRTDTDHGAARTIRPHLEQLEERAAPTANIFGEYFRMPQGALYVPYQTVQPPQQGVYTLQGDFYTWAYGTEVPVPVTVKLTPGAFWDQVSFQGAASAGASGGIATAIVNFNGYVSEPNLFQGKTEMEGTLNVIDYLFTAFPPYLQAQSSSNYAAAWGQQSPQ